MATSIDTIKQYIDGHKEYNEHEDEWELFRRSYVGGSEYKEGEYLLQHALETSTAFSRRVEQSMFVNYCSPVVDIYNAYLFKERPSRKIEGMDVITGKQFMENADMEGRGFHKLMRELSRWAGVFGHMGVIVDKPISVDAQSRAEELNAGMRPYVSYYTPSNIVYWEWERVFGGPPRLKTLVLREEELEEGVEVYRVWYVDRWELWSVDETDKKMSTPPELIDQGEYALGEIPFVVLRNRDSLDRMSGVSDIADIAHINKRIYYYDSDALEIIERTAYPFLEAPVNPFGGPSDADTVIGTSNVLERDAANDTVGHRWIEPSHASLQRILEWRTQAVQDIRETAKMGGMQSNARQGVAAFSGSALEIRFQQLAAVLADKAENMENAEYRIIRLASMWEGLSGDAEIHYPRKFGIRDVISDLDQAIRAKDVVVSPVYDKLVQKNIASRTLADMGYDAPAIKTAEDDIDQQPYIPTANQFASAGGMNGISVVETSKSNQQDQLDAQNAGVVDNADTAGNGQ